MDCDCTMRTTNCSQLCRLSHYENLSMQNTVIFSVVKIENFQLKNFDIFLIFAQNIYRLWVHVRTASPRRF